MYSQKSGGGIHEVVSNLSIQQMQDQNRKIVVCAPFAKDDDQPQDSSKSIIRTKLITRNPALFILKIITIMKSIKRPVDTVIHQHGIWTSMSMMKVVVQTFSGVKSIVQPHGLLAPYRLLKTKYFKIIALATLEGWNLRSAAVLVACSEPELRVLKRRYPQKPVALIPNGISPEYFETPPQRSQKHGNSKKKLLFFSQIIPVKGLERFIDILNSMGEDFSNDWYFEIAGYGTPAYVENIQKKINRLGLEEHIKVTGPVYGKERVHLLDSCDAFVLPTFDENFGIVVAEAMARKKLVITTKGAPWNEIEDVDAGFWVENTKDGLFNGVSQLVKLSSKEILQKGLNGHQLVYSKYSWQIIKQKYDELYEYVLDRRIKPNFIH